ncbi:MAG TPA: amidophosphoribosyltransferase [Dehalococcoidales bacterium]
MCGVIGIVGDDSAASRITLGLYDLQHRGEQAFGIATSDGKDIYHYVRRGLVTEAFSEDEQSPIAILPGNMGIGHTLYSTIGSSGEGKQTKTFQPLLADFHGEKFALAHNGNLINLEPLRKEAEDSGYHFNSRVSDTEVIVALLSASKKTDFLEALITILPRLQGAFSLVILHKDKVIGVRDKNGIRPLCLGRISNSHYVIASEDCALHTLGGSFIRELRPGELIVLSQHGIERALIWAKSPQLKLCIFELVYFARPDSSVGGQRVYWYRENAGHAVALEHPVKGADLVSSIPESGTIYNYGVSQALGVPIRRAISRNRYYARRTFLMPRETNRKSLQESKFYILRELVANKVIIITEDSVIRGNVGPGVVGMLRKMGANEVHLLVGSAPIKYPCFLGIDIPNQSELIAAENTLDEIKEQLCLDSLGYLSIDGMVKSSGLPSSSLCMGCFNGVYPVNPPQNLKNANVL